MLKLIQHYTPKSKKSCQIKMEVLLAALRRITAGIPEDLKRFQDQMESEHPVTLTLSYMDDRDAIKVDGIVVDKAKRKGGEGSKIMEKLTEFADNHKLLIYLEPSTDFGATSVARLKRFYARFGFKPNTGRNKDFRFFAGMIRQPT